MRKLKSTLKYIGFTIISLFLIVTALIAGYLFYTNAPITNGKVAYNISFKENLEIDIYAPTKTIFKKSPVIFYIHGGAWIIGDKFTINSNRFNGAINSLRENGYTIICPNYTLGKKGKSPFPSCIEDVYDAIDWAKKNAQKYNLDIQNIGLLGESAGAQIAMIIAFSDNHFKKQKQEKIKFNFLIDVYGPSDLISMYNSPEVENLNNRLNKFLSLAGDPINLKEYVFGFNPEEDKSKANVFLENYSPLKFISKKNFPTLIIHGKEDQIVSVKQSEVLNSKMNSLGLKNEIHLFDGMDHSLRKATQKQKDTVQLLITDFVLKNYNHKNLTLNEKRFK
ncbi:alpha/beta hydrolase [Confluentibacter lentus]|uniref:alpha/beta hydrolase n=1 Tax=Confluentibacter lentus TaxID=1699412 RepID=UPI000C28D253|nr:alpha/beta hydrolase [Confluentibacter lentus]